MRRGTGQRGLSQSVQFALLFPLVLMLFFIALQWAMYAWASAIALAAAQDGARAASGYEASEASGRKAAAEAITGDVLRDPTVTVDRSATLTTVTVRGRAIAIFGVPVLTVSRSASVATERLTR